MATFGTSQPFSFGTPSTGPAFGATAATATTGTLFGAPATTTSSSLFGPPSTSTSIFGSSSAPSLFGTATTTASTGLFGAKPAAAAAPFSFAAPQTTTASLFGQTSTAQPATGLFGATNPATQTLGFAATQAKPGFSFGTTTTAPATTFALQPQQQLQQQQQQTQVSLSPLQLLLKILHSPGRFPGDERDAIIAKWNQLQALCGTGKALWSPDGQQESYQDLHADNPFSKFKAVGYAFSPLLADIKANDAEAGQLVFIISKDVKEVKPQTQQIIDGLHQMLTNKNVAFVWGFKEPEATPQGTTKLVVHCDRKDAAGTATPIPAKDLQKEIEGNASVTSALKTQLGVVGIFPKVPPTKDGIKEQLENYLKTPPVGIDAMLWDQAKKDNPDPASLIPVPLLGFDTLKSRLTQQEEQCTAHQSRLDAIASDITSLKNTESSTQAKMAQLKRSQLEMGHRLLKVVVKQEIVRKTGMAISIDEEQLRTRLEALQTELNSPTQFKGRLNELLSLLRMHGGIGDVSGGGSRSRMGLGDPVVMAQVKQLMAEQHSGIKALLSVVKEDLEDLKTMEDGWMAATSITAGPKRG